MMYEEILVPKQKRIPLQVAEITGDLFRKAFRNVIQFSPLVPMLEARHVQVTVGKQHRTTGCIATFVRADSSQARHALWHGEPSRRTRIA